tara:strand:- start:3464 stop:4141 length:678 start_codon:yes stop_codon:yes gene_type:complete
MALTKISAGVMAADSVETASISNSNVTTAKINALAVTTAKINNDAITNAKIGADAVDITEMLGNSAYDGQLLTYDTSGNPTRLAVGTVQGSNTGTLFHSGQFLQTGGAGAEPAWKTPLFSKFYESATTDWAVNSVITFTHGLGAIPKLVQVVWKLIAAEDGYSIGDELVLHDGGDGDVGSSIASDSTTIQVAFGSSVVVINQGSFTGGAIDPANTKTKLIARGWL